MDRCVHADGHNVSEYIDQAPDAATLLVSRSSRTHALLKAILHYALGLRFAGYFFNAFD